MTAIRSGKGKTVRPSEKRESDELRLRAHNIYEELKALYPYAHAELDFDGPYQLLVAAVLSAQTTDIRVNQVTPLLFRKYPDPEALAGAHTGDVEDIIRSLGFYRAKAANIIKLAAMVVDSFDGRVPGTQEELIQLPGVGKKTANVVLGNVFGVPGLTVDTHFIRLVNVWEWVQTKNPTQIEEKIATLFDRREWTMLSHVIIFHGRRMCIARRPLCGVCPIAKYCPSYGIGETDPCKAAKLLRFETAPGMAYAPELYPIGEGPAENSVRVDSHTAVFFPAWRQEPAKPEGLERSNARYGSNRAPGGGKKMLRPKTA